MIVTGLFKLLIFVFFLVMYFITTLPLLPFFYLRPFKIRKILNFIVHFYSRIVLFFLNVHVQWNIKESLPHSGKLIVSNHLSYMDILVLASRIPSSFVTSTEMKETFGLGHICILAGCVFVNRKNKKNIHQEVREITDALKSNINVIVFPEATSTNGEEVIRFRRPLFQSAIDAGQNVSPITLNYQQVNNVKVSLQNRDSVFWYGDMTFFDHFWNFLKLKRVDVRVSIDTELMIGSFADTISLSTASYDIVKSSYDPVQS